MKSRVLFRISCVFMLLIVASTAIWFWVSSHGKKEDILAPRPQSLQSRANGEEKRLQKEIANTTDTIQVKRDRNIPVGDQEVKKVLNQNSFPLDSRFPQNEILIENVSPWTNSHEACLLVKKSQERFARISTLQYHYKNEYSAPYGTLDHEGDVWFKTPFSIRKEAHGKAVDYLYIADRLMQQKIMHWDRSLKHPDSVQITDEDKVITPAFSGNNSVSLCVEIIMCSPPEDFDPFGEQMIDNTLCKIVHYKGMIFWLEASTGLLKKVAVFHPSGFKLHEWSGFVYTEIAHDGQQFSLPTEVLLTSFVPEGKNAVVKQSFSSFRINEDIPDSMFRFISSP